jgi:N-6 DNA Methylase
MISMSEYQPYVEHLEELVEALVFDHQFDITSNDRVVQEALDGGAPAALRRLVTIEDRRDTGAFFTSSRLADLVWEPFLPTLNNDSVIVDPACGAGSLLIPGLRALLQRADPWQAVMQIRGRDLAGTFVKAAHARLILAIASSPSLSEQVRCRDIRFPELRQGDALEEMMSLLENATHIVLNPPYNLVTAPKGCPWASGKINRAALFTEAVVQLMPVGSRLGAILPEVLRSGPRYAKWRDVIRRTARIDEVIPSGAFDSHTDVDVFRLYLSKEPSGRASASGETSAPAHLLNGKVSRSCPAEGAGQHVSALFQISVGAVVPHRHPEEGPVRPFATARELPVWQTTAKIAKERKFSGRCEIPPFVVIRRTSRPGQAPRALATIVTGSNHIAVDNHLIVARPFDGSIDRCQQLLDLLQLPGTTKWLDERYRCHHLPVEAIKFIPWETGGYSASR